MHAQRYALCTCVMHVMRICAVYGSQPEVTTVLKMSDSSSSSNTSAALVGFLSDPATIAGLAAIAVGTAWYLSSRAPAPVKPPVAVDNQSLELTVILI